MKGALVICKELKRFENHFCIVVHYIISSHYNCKAIESHYIKYKYSCLIFDVAKEFEIVLFIIVPYVDLGNCFSWFERPWLKSTQPNFNNHDYKLKCWLPGHRTFYHVWRVQYTTERTHERMCVYNTLAGHVTRTCGRDCWSYIAVTVISTLPLHILSHWSVHQLYH